MKKRLYLHIGQTKTGTTALQVFLHDNRAALRTHGVDYPAVPDSEPIKTQHRFLVKCLQSPSDDRTLANKVWDPYVRALADSDQPIAVISEEVFWHLMEHQRDRRARALDWIADKLKVFDVRIVCYLRPQDRWIESWFNQIVKTDSDAVAALRFPDFVKRYHALGLLDYAAVLGEWAARFGHEAMVVRSSERPSLVNNDVIDDFCSLIGVLPDKDWPRPGNVQQHLSAASCHFVGVFNRTVRAQALKPKFVAALSNSPKSSEEQPRLLSTEQAENLLARYAASNREVASRYCGREHLFLPAVPQPDEHDAYRGPGPDDLAELVIRLFVSQQREIEALRKKLADLSPRTVEK